jgi:hypothetical protein
LIRIKTVKKRNLTHSLLTTVKGLSKQDSDRHMRVGGDARRNGWSPKPLDWGERHWYSSRGFAFPAIQLTYGFLKKTNTLRITNVKESIARQGMAWDSEPES